MWIFINFLIVSTALFFLPRAGDIFWRPKESLFILGGLLFVALCWFKNKNNNFKNNWLNALFIYITLNFAWYFLVPITFDYKGKIFWEWWTLLPSLNVLMSIIIIRQLVEYTDNLKRWVNVAKILCGLCVFISIYSMLQYFGFDQIFPRISTNYVHPDTIDKQSHNMFSLFGNKMLTTNYISAICPLFMIFKGKKYISGLVICLVALIMSKSFMNLGIAIFGISLVYLLSGKYKVFILIILSGILLLFIFKHNTNFIDLFKGGFHGRVGFMKIALERLKSRIWTGYGLGSLPRDFAANNMLYRWHSTHNLIFDLLYETGIIGIVIALGYLFNLFWRALMASKNSILLIGFLASGISYFLMSMGSFPHRIAPLALLGIIYISAMEALTLKGE